VAELFSVIVLEIIIFSSGFSSSHSFFGKAGCLRLRKAITWQFLEKQVTSGSQRLFLVMNNFIV